MNSLHRYQLWLKWMKHIPAPQDFIDMSFFWMMGAALQRRIYLQSEEKPLFGNTYVILVGKPGLGKGLAIDPTIEALKFHKLRDITKNHKPSVVTVAPPTDLSPEQKAILEATQKVEKTIEELAAKSNSVKRLQDPLLFPVAPDDITYEELVHTMAGSIRRLNVYPTPVLAPNGSYGHCSMAIGLSEMATLFKKQSEKTLKFMLKAFDCGDYEYSTKTQGHDVVKRCCLSILAGTTPGQIQEMLDYNVIDAGWSSRCIFVWAEEERFKTFYIRDFDDEQREAYREILEHLKNLSRIFGKIKYSDETLEYLMEYFCNPSTYQNPHPNLEPYYKRKNIHIPKLALAMMFSDIDIMWKDGKPLFETTLSLGYVKKAIELLERIEKNMHLALCVGQKNPIAELTQKIVDYLRGGKSFTKCELLIRFWGDCPNGTMSLDEALNHLMSIGKLKTTDDNPPKFKLK